MRKIRIKNVLFNIFAIITVLVTGFVAFLMISGTKAYAVQTDSMYPEFTKGAVVFIKPTTFDELKTGDIVTVKFPDDTGVFTHRIVNKDIEERTIYTKGDHNMGKDPKASDESLIVGKMWFTAPYIGYISLKLDSYAVLYFMLGLATLLLITRIVVQTIKKTNS